MNPKLLHDINLTQKRFLQRQNTTKDQQNDSVVYEGIALRKK